MENDVGKNDGQPVIRSVLPLPSGYLDEITDYLICYDGVSHAMIFAFVRITKLTNNISCIMNIFLKATNR